MAAAAAWIPTLIAVIALLLMVKSDSGTKGFTPQQVEQIIQQIRDDPACEQPDSQRQLRPVHPAPQTVILPRAETARGLRVE